MRAFSGSLQAPVVPRSPTREIHRGVMTARKINISEGILDGLTGSATPRSISRLMVRSNCTQAQAIVNDHAQPRGVADATQRDVTTLLNQQRESLREEISRMSVELVRDLEARLTVQIEDAKSTTDAHVQAMTGAIQGLSEKIESTTEAQIKTLEASATEAEALGAESKQYMKEIPECESDPSIGTTIICDKSLPDDLLKKISDHVIHRVNADPRVCQLVESHQSLQESFSKLLRLLEKAPPTNEQKHVNQQPVKDVVLYDMMLDVQKCCKSIALEVRQVRQRRNQDCSDTMLRFEKIEKKQKVIDDALLLDSNKETNVEAFESKGVAGDNHSLQLVEEDSFVEEADVQ